MAKKKAAKSRLIPEARLEPLRAEVERLAAESEKVTDFKWACGNRRGKNPRPEG
jgi:hypothetical protein